MPSRRVFSLAAFALLGTVCFASLSADAQTVTNGKIVFARAENNFSDIYTVNADGTGLKRLTTGAASTPRYDNIDPEWSPDATKIIFASTRDNPYPETCPDNTEIYLMDATDANGDNNGDNLRRLTYIPGFNEHPTWSPDGLKIAFTTNREGLDSTKIYVMNADGTGAHAVAGTEDSYDPAWSPDGVRITFVKQPAGQTTHIYVVNSDGTELLRLTNSATYDRSPAWSPTSTRIVFSSNASAPSTGHYEIYVMDAADADHDGVGDNLTRITTTGGNINNADPAWSPDGRKIAFSTNRDDPTPDPDNGNYELYSIDAPSGGSPTPITRLPTSDSSPNWQRLTSLLTLSRRQTVRFEVQRCDPRVAQRPLRVELLLLDTDGRVLKRTLITLERGSNALLELSPDEISVRSSDGMRVSAVAHVLAGQRARGVCLTQRLTAR